MRKPLGLSIFISILLIACSTNNLESLSLHCSCKVDEHYSVSTDEDDNSTKEYTFTDSQLFDFGVVRKDYALSAALFIYQNLDTTTYNNLKLNFIKTGTREKRYEYSIEELSKQLPVYSQIESLTNQFVTDVYNQNYNGCIEKISSDVSEDKVKEALDNARKDFYEDYQATEIVSYKKTKNRYDIFGAILTQDNKKDLFKMNFANINGVLTIVSFEF